MRFTPWIMLILMGLLASPTFAQLQEHHVLLVYNSKNTVSNSIAQHYLQARPNVIPFDLDITYATPSDLSDPGEYAATAYYITPQAFLEWVRDPILEFLSTDPAGPSIRAMATTRGVPAVVSTHFALGETHYNNSGEGGNGAFARGGFEALLSRLNYGDSTLWENLASGSSLSMSMSNPYHGKFALPFDDWLTNSPSVDACGLPNPSGTQYDGKIFLVSRLDSERQWSPEDEDFPLWTNDAAYIDAVTDLIDRSQDLTVNKFEVTLIVDDNCSSHLHPAKPAMQFMHNRGWFTHYDETDEFLYGTHSPDANPAHEYLDYPELVRATMGRNHHRFANCPDAGEAPRCYIWHTEPHPAGVFIAIESYSGTTLRDPWNTPGPYGCDYDVVAQGKGLAWIGRGGSFACPSVVGHTQWEVMKADMVVANLYVHGLTWAEAAYSSLHQLGHYQTPIGDPLATVKVLDPDVNGDGTTNEQDMLIVLASYGSCPDPNDCPADVNGDGVVDNADVQVVLNTPTRSLPPDPELWHNYWPGSAPHGIDRKGDSNPNGVVDHNDFERVIGALDEFCPSIDVTGEGWVDQNDLLSVLCNWGRVVGDFNGDCTVNTQDFIILVAAWGSCPSPCPPDLNNDGVVNVDDLNMLVNFSLWNQTIEDCDQLPSPALLATIPIGYLDGWMDDCNSNGLPDDCEIGKGWTDDLNENGIPDDCE